MLFRNIMLRKETVPFVGTKTRPLFGPAMAVVIPSVLRKFRKGMV